MNKTRAGEIDSMLSEATCDWLWMQAANHFIDRYYELRERTPVTEGMREAAMDDINYFASCHLECGTQGDINEMYYIEREAVRFLTINDYRKFLQSVKTQKL